MNPEHEALEKTKILHETAKIPWSELQRFFAAGQVYQVMDGLDLVAVALSFMQDQSAQVKAWLDDSSITPVGDAQARQWLDDDAQVWAVVVKPVVLVQAIAA